MHCQVGWDIVGRRGGAQRKHHHLQDGGPDVAGQRLAGSGLSGGRPGGSSCWPPPQVASPQSFDMAGECSYWNDTRDPVEHHQWEGQRVECALPFSSNPTFDEAVVGLLDTSVSVIQEHQVVADLFEGARNCVADPGSAHALYRWPAVVTARRCCNYLQGGGLVLFSRWWVHTFCWDSS